MGGHNPQSDLIDRGDQGIQGLKIAGRSLCSMAVFHLFPMATKYFPRCVTSKRLYEIYRLSKKVLKQMVVNNKTKSNFKDKSEENQAKIG